MNNPNLYNIFTSNGHRSSETQPGKQSETIFWAQTKKVQLLHLYLGRFLFRRLLYIEIQDFSFTQTNTKRKYKYGTGYVLIN